MNSLYQRTFDQIQLEESKADFLRAVLTSSSSDIKTEEINMKKKGFLTRPAGILAAALLICAFSITAFAYGGRIIESVYQFMSGGTVEQGLDENGDAYTAGSIDTEDVISPVELRENGKLYLVVNSEEKDITDQFSYTEPYVYECTNEDGLRHAFVIGGELDAIGWSEFIWDENGMPTAGSSMFGTSGGRDDAPWLDIAMDELGLPW